MMIWLHRISSSARQSSRAAVLDFIESAIRPKVEKQVDEWVDSLGAGEISSYVTDALSLAQDAALQVILFLFALILVVVMIFLIVRSLQVPGEGAQDRTFQNLVRLAHLNEVRQLTIRGNRAIDAEVVWRGREESWEGVPVPEYAKDELLRSIKGIGPVASQTLLAALPDAKVGDLLLFGADKASIVHDVLGRLRLLLGEELKLIDTDAWKPLWVIDFPLLDYDQEAKRYVAMHHPFTAPMDKDLPLIESEPLKVRAKAYDLVLNGNEIGGGSIRIHRLDVQSKVFDLLGIGKEDNWKKLTAGESGIHEITRFPTEGLRTKVAGTIDFIPARAA